jgi:hypothetical protein
MILGNAKNPTGPVPVREAAAGSRLSVVSAEIRMLGIQEIRQAQMPKPSGAVSLTRKNTKNRTLPGFQKTEKITGLPAPGNGMRNPERPVKRDRLIVHPVNILIKAADLLKKGRIVLMLRDFQKTIMKENLSVPESATRSPELRVKRDILIIHPVMFLIKTGSLTK